MSKQNNLDFIKDKVEQEYKDLVFDIKYDKEQFKELLKERHNEKIQSR